MYDLINYPPPRINSTYPGNRKKTSSDCFFFLPILPNTLAHGIAKTYLFVANQQSPTHNETPTKHGSTQPRTKNPPQRPQSFPGDSGPGNNWAVQAGSPVDINAWNSQTTSFLMDGWMFGDFHPIFHVKIWERFIIQLIANHKKKLLGHQVPGVELWGPYK